MIEPENFLNSRKEDEKVSLEFPCRRTDRFFCTFQDCSKSYNKPSKLAEHIRSHTNDRIYKCTVEGCEKSFLRNGHLTRHFKSSHSANPKPFACEFPSCHSKFSLRHQLKRHQKLHSTPKPFICSIPDCKESFSKHSQLYIHNCRVHLKEEPFKCSECNLTFDLKSKLNKHNKIKHSNHSFLCGHQNCLESFKTWSQFVNHRKLHSSSENQNISCQQCDKMFSNQKSLHIHQKIHLNSTIPDPNITCPIQDCKIELKSQSALKSHLKLLHFGLKPFQCSNCSKTFAQNRTLQNHLLKCQTLENVRFNPTNYNKNNNNQIDNFGFVDNVIDSIPSSSFDSLLRELTGLDYENNRNLSCPINGCRRRFFRQYDLDIHLSSSHPI
jgi:general transcription factor IIIA